MHNRIAVTSVDCMCIYEGVCVLCAVKLDDKASAVNLRGRPSFPIELELTKLPFKLAINDSTRMCFPGHRKRPSGKISRQQRKFPTP